MWANPYQMYTELVMSHKGVNQTIGQSSRFLSQQWSSGTREASQCAP
jgi:hypothetical protein